MKDRELKPSLVLAFFAFQAAFGMICAGLFYYFRLPQSAAQFTGSPVAIAQAVGLSLPLLGLAWFFTSDRGLSFRPFKEIFDRLMDSPFGTFIRHGSPALFFIMATLAGVGEELGFRGLLQNKTNIIAASVIFGAVHFVTPTFFTIATLIGFYLGWVFVWTGHNLFPPMFIHMIYDLVMLLLLKSRTRKAVEQPIKL